MRTVGRIFISLCCGFTGFVMLATLMAPPENTLLAGLLAGTVAGASFTAGWFATE